MAVNVSIKRIQPAGLLSFPHTTEPLELGALNVLIGPNAAGKSNLLDIMRLLESTPSDIQHAIRDGGGAQNWIWSDDRSKSPELEVVTECFGVEFLHRLTFSANDTELIPVQESIWHRPDTLVFEHIRGAEKSRLLRQDLVETQPSDPELRERPDHPIPSEQFELMRERTGTLVVVSHQGPTNQSVLSKFKSLLDYPQLSFLSTCYKSIEIFGDWTIGRGSPLRNPQPTDSRNDRLEVDFCNLGMFLNKLQTKPEAKQRVLDGMRELYESFTDFATVVTSGTVQTHFTESNRRSVPASRLSDGALRYLCLLAILYGDDLATVTCIEEPELGLHPDIVANIAKHLRAASEQKQLVVTTHSEVIVDSLSDVPESVIVFENDGSGTRMNRLDSNSLSKWLTDYRLGELWTSGQLGGTRW